MTKENRYTKREQLNGRIKRKGEMKITTVVKMNRVCVCHLKVLLNLCRYSFMTACWNVMPELRPSFEQIAKTLEKMLERKQVNYV